MTETQIELEAKSVLAEIYQISAEIWDAAFFLNIPSLCDEINLITEQSNEIWHTITD